MQSRNAVAQRFPSVESLDSWAHDHGDSIEVSAEALHRSIRGGSNGNNGGAVRVVFAAYNQLDRLLEPRKKRGFQVWLHRICI